MRINNNLAALNTYSKMVSNISNNAKSLEKLSSGLRINKAGDDAAGLSISEKMRSQIRGLDQSTRNAQDSISMIQTAEGALSETESILQRMRELSVQSANATNTSSDRSVLSDEITQLKNEIDRIGNNTEFNTMKLLNGDLKSSGGATSSGNKTVGAAVFEQTAASLVASTESFSAGDYTAVSLSMDESVTVDNVQIKIEWGSKLSAEEKSLLDSTYDSTAMTSDQKTKIKSSLQRVVNDSIDEYNSSNSGSVNHVKVFENGSGRLVMKSGDTGTNSKLSWSNVEGAVLNTFFGISDGASAVGINKIVSNTASATISFKVNGVRIQTSAIATFSAGGNAATGIAVSLQGKMRTAVSAYNSLVGLTDGKDGYVNPDEIFVNVKEGRIEVKSTSDASIEFLQDEGEKLVEQLGLTDSQTSGAGNGGLTFQIGANKNQTLNLGINDMRAQGLGIGGINIKSQSNAANAIDLIDAAISKVSSERSKLGAVQNRLDHTINNLTTSSENLTAAESRIRDVDMAKEMMNFTKTNILNQAAQSMLAQANQQPQGVLSLLR